MKAFKFSLQALLVIREQEEQKALHIYAKALVARERAVSEVHAVEEELAVAWADFHTRLQEGSPAADLAQRQQFCQTVDRRREELEHVAQVARQRSQQAFVQLLAARQARDVLQQYADKQKQRYRRARRQKEQKALDDQPVRQNALVSLLQLQPATLWN